MADQLWRTEWKSQNLRVTLVDCSNLTKKLVNDHGAKGWMSIFYTKALASGLLVSPMLVNDERYTLRWQYEGELKTITIDVGSNGVVRGYPDQLEIEANSLEEIFGLGGKVGTVKSNQHRRLNSGMTLADRCDIALDLATSFTISDQIPTTILIDVKTQPWQTRGWMIQALPEVGFEEFEDLRKIFESEETIEHFSKLESIEPEQVEALLKGLGFPEHNTKLLVHQQLVPDSFCECNRKKITQVLMSLPTEELEDMIESDGGAQIDCQFCNTCYRFDIEDLKKIIHDKKS